MSVALRLSIQRDKNGVVVKGTRTHNGAGGFSSEFKSATDVKAYLEKLQPIITDTITGAELIVTTALPDSVVPTVPAGMSNDAWADMDNVKLTNEYTDGDQFNAKESIARPATAATEEQLRTYAQATANWGTREMNAIQGYFSGTSVESAWQQE